MSERKSGQGMEEMWGEQVVKLRAEDATRGQLFSEGNYAMFIHWGPYSNLANEVDGKTYYGIGEWIMHPRMAGIPVEDYKRRAASFHPVRFDADEIAEMAKSAGMKYIVITSKHHDGFAMYHSKADGFNIVDATPFDRDPMGELAVACKKVGIGFGFYYSHNQDWTFPGGSGGPETNEAGQAADFDDYFQKKCLPQVEEITTEYGPIEIVWFDTPGNMPKEYVEQLVAVIRKNQPNALVSGRAGHDLGDYQTLGDMDVPLHNVDGMWESVDTTNDSWAYAWYDEYWKSPQEILRRLIACVGRGGTYMLNLGLRGDGSMPERATRALRAGGDWIRRYPQVVYAAEASPWQHALPWGDITRKGNTLYLAVLQWPASGALYLPGLKGDIVAARLLNGQESESIDYKKERGWIRFSLPPQMPDALVSIIEVELATAPQVDPTWGLDPECTTEIQADFATVTDATKDSIRWMEKFGEWKHVTRVHQWQAQGEAMWEVDVLVPGDYQVDLTIAGEGRLVWGVGVKGGEHIQNEQNSSHNYQTFPIGLLSFPAPGRYEVCVCCMGGNVETASLHSIHFVRAQW